SAGPNGAADTNLLTINWLNPSPTTRYYPAMRVDYNISQKLRLDFSLQETKINQPNVTPPIFPGPDFANQISSNKSSNYITSVGLNWKIGRASCRERVEISDACVTVRKKRWRAA